VDLDLISRWTQSRVSNLQVYNLAHFPSCSNWTIFLPSMYKPLISEVGFRNDTKLGGSCKDGWAQMTPKLTLAGQIWPGQSYGLPVKMDEQVIINWQSDNSLR
jgi:hypothetical protein